MIYYRIKRSALLDNVLIPKCYDPDINQYFDDISSTHSIISIGDLIKRNILLVSTGHEIGKMAYGTGEIPFIRTSDISNWEIKTLPKQGISEDIYKEYSSKQDLQVGDVLLVRDGTYLIGTNCIISELDKKALYQSHLLKFRIEKNELLDPYLFFILLNTDIVQRQIRSIQFTADTIDTIGNRYTDIKLPIPKDKNVSLEIAKIASLAMDNRERGKALIKGLPLLIEECLISNSIDPICEFISKPWDEIIAGLSQDTITAEFGEFETFWINKSALNNDILLPKYYDPDVYEELSFLEETCDLIKISTLSEMGVLTYNTGDEIGKMAYGTGDIPFLRTSDFSNWEIKHDPKQGISEEIYMEYKNSQDIQENDILLVRDGTYLIGTSCIITPEDKKSLYCGGLYKFRVLNEAYLSPYLLLGLLNSYIVKRQIRTKQFTRDVIDTIGKRIEEVIIPIPKSESLRVKIALEIEKVITTRMSSRIDIKKLAERVVSA